MCLCLLLTGCGRQRDIHMQTVTVFIAGIRAENMYQIEILEDGIIKTTNNEFIVNIPIKKILLMLDNRFKMSHRGCVINEERIVEKNYIKGYFITDTKEKVMMLSKKYREQ